MQKISFALFLGALAILSAHAGECEISFAAEPTGAMGALDSFPAAPSPWTKSVLPGTHRLSVTSTGWSDTAFEIACDSTAVVVAPRLRRTKSSADSAKAARADSLSRARREFARATLAKASDDLPAALDRLSSGIHRDSGQILSLAVLPFQAVGGAPSEAATMASETAILRLSKDPRWKLVERERFQSVLQEQALWGAAAAASELEVGRALEARYLLAGTVAVDGLRRMVALRLIDATDGRVVAASAAKVDGPAMDEALKQALGEKLDMSGAVFRSLIVPGWGQFWTDRPLRGSFWLAADAGLVGAFVWSILDWADKDNTAQTYKDRDAATFSPGESPDRWLQRANKAVQERNDAADRNLIIGSTLAGVWALNVADAAWCGWRAAHTTRERYFAFSPILTPDAAGLRLSLSLGGTTR